MAFEKWVVLTEHHMPVGWIPTDSGELQLLCIESELLSQGIEVAFDPRRPGDAHYTRGLAVDIQLLVKSSDLSRAQEIVATLDEGVVNATALEHLALDPSGIKVGDRVRFVSAPPPDTEWGDYDACWDSGDDRLLGTVASVIEMDDDGWFRVDTGPDDGWFVPAWVEKVDAG